MGQIFFSILVLIWVQGLLYVVDAQFAFDDDEISSGANDDMKEKILSKSEKLFDMGEKVLKTLLSPVWFPRQDSWG